jgi:hypothetical protein
MYTLLSSLPYLTIVENNFLELQLIFEGVVFFISHFIIQRYITRFYSKATVWFNCYRSWTSIVTYKNIHVFTNVNFFVIAPKMISILYYICTLIKWEIKNTTPSKQFQYQIVNGKNRNKMDPKITNNVIYNQ